jgi:hypothetical protein
VIDVNDLNYEVAIYLSRATMTRKSHTSSNINVNRYDIMYHSYGRERRGFSADDDGYII